MIFFSPKIYFTGYNNEKNCYDTIIEYIKYFGYLIYHKKIEEQLYCDTCLKIPININIKKVKSDSDNINKSILITHKFMCMDCNNYIEKQLEIKTFYILCFHYNKNYIIPKKVISTEISHWQNELNKTIEDNV